MASTVGARSAKPRYLQIADDIEEQIKGGALAPAEEIPSETVLMELMGSRRALSVRQWLNSGRSAWWKRTKVEAPSSSPDLRSP